MPLFGAHLSIAGGFYKAPNAAGAFGMETVQIFTHSPSQWCVTAVPAGGKGVQSGKFLTKNNNQWAGKPLADEDIRLFKDALRAHQLSRPTAHDSYLINLASPDDALRTRSLDAFAVEMERAEALGIEYLVMHPGTPTDGDEDVGLKRIAAALNEILRRCPGFQVMPLLETTAGQGRSLGHRFEHLARIRELSAAPERLGICLDTCHVFAAGYALAPKPAYAATFQEFDDVIGIEHLKAFHLNDSKKPFGSRVDRHEHIGQGCLGADAFRLLVNDPRFAKHPMFLETAKEGDNDEEMDAVNLATLRSLVTKKRKSPIKF